jgi:hypothetical protein
VNGKTKKPDQPVRTAVRSRRETISITSAALPQVMTAKYICPPHDTRFYTIFRVKTKKERMSKVLNMKCLTSDGEHNILGDAETSR